MLLIVELWICAMFETTSVQIRGLKIVKGYEMEITIGLIISAVFVLFGLKIIYIGKLDIEYGVTNGESGTRTKFLSSKEGKLEGTAARLVGVVVSILGVLIYLFADLGDVLFVL